jgi:hypothetical protein
MRKLLLVFIALAAIALTALTGAPTSTAKTSAGDTYGVGGGKAFGIAVTFSFSAHQGPKGDFGQVVVKNDAFQFSATVKVDCVNIFGPFPLFNVTAMGGWISGLVTKASPQPNVGSVAVGDRILYITNDGGQPSARPVDFFNGIEMPPAFSCKPLGTDFPPPNVTQGNITIKNG